nr:hypothetical protein [Bacillus haynesii]
MKSGKVSIEDLAIIDPHERPLDIWKRNTERVRMEYLRSPSVHHIDVTPFSLQTYADKSQWAEVFFGRYKRPALSLFNQHCDAMCLIRISGALRIKTFLWLSSVEGLQQLIIQ